MTIKESRQKALEKIIDILKKGNIDEQFNSRSGSYYSSDKFIVSWLGSWNRMEVEYSIDKVDSSYTAFSGYKAIYSRRNLFYEKQLEGFGSIERALISVGLKLCDNKGDKVAFFNEFAKPYNEKLKSKIGENE